METGIWTTSECPIEEALWIGDSYATSKWQHILHFELVIAKTTLSTTQNLHYQLVEKLHYQLHLKVETGKLTISECPLEEAMRIGHWVTIQQFHSGNNFLHYELVISSKWKHSGVTDGLKIPDLS